MRKAWYKSKTVWFNILTIGGAVAGGLGGLLPHLGPVLDEQHYQILLFTVGAINVVLRTVTNGPIKWTDSPSSE